MASANDMTSIETKIEAARAEAQVVCAEMGETSPQCAAAWDIVEELQAEASHQQANKPPAKNALQRFCEENPDAAECRIYED